MGFDSLYFFGWIGSTSVGPLAFDVSPSSYPRLFFGGLYIRFPHAWGDPRLGACAHEHAVAYLQKSRLQWPLASLIQPSYTPPSESCVQREADQGWVGVSCTSQGAWTMRGWESFWASPDRDFRSAPASPYRVCACLFMSFL